MNATQRLIKAVEEVFRLSQLDYDGIDILVQRSAANQEVKEALAAAKEEAERSPTWLGHCSGCTDPHSEGTHQMGTVEHPDPLKEAERKVLTDEEMKYPVMPWPWIDEETLSGIKMAIVIAFHDLGHRKNKEAIDALHARIVRHIKGQPIKPFKRSIYEFCKDNGYLAPTTGIDVEGVIRLIRDDYMAKTYQAYGLLRYVCCGGDAEDRIHKFGCKAEAMLKALEAHAENRGGNLRTDPWISAEDRLPDEGDYEMSAYVLGWTGDEVVKCFYTYRYQEWRTDTGYVHRTIASWMPLPAPPDNTDKG